MKFKVAFLFCFLGLKLIMNAQPKRAMIRLEDVGPGGFYGSKEGCDKLKVIADYLYSENIPFQIALIPRFKNPLAGVDRSISDLSDPISVYFVQTLKYCQSKGASIGLHGYTHQVLNAISGEGFEFFGAANSNCTPNCPQQDDIPSAIENKEDFDASQVSVRLKAAYEATNAVGLKIDFFETPHYQASFNQVQLIEAWSGLIYEHFSKNVKLLNTGNEDIFSNGTLYVPTPLGYVTGTEKLNKLCKDIQSYGPNDIASFFFHAFLEFNSMKLNPDGSLNSYDPGSFLHQLVNSFKAQKFSFVGIRSLTNFIPSKRQTSIQHNNSKLLIGDVNADSISELIFWDPSTGNWEVGKNTLVRPPQRVQADYTMSSYLHNWAVGDVWEPLIADLNGDKKDDVLVYNASAGQWQAALSDGNKFVPHPGSTGNYIWLNGWGKGENWKPFCGDFDGDGKDDVLLYDNTTGEWQVAFSTGNDLLPNAGEADNYIWLDHWGVGPAWKPLIGDYNGDGKDDLTLYNSTDGGWQVALSNGKAFIPNAGVFGTNYWKINWGVGPQWQPLIGDFNGDKKADIMVTNLTNGNWQIALSTGTQFKCHGTAFMGWGKYLKAIPLTGYFTANAKSSILLWNKNLFNGTIDFALSNVGNENNAEYKNTDTLVNTNFFINAPTIYPNPTKENLNVHFDILGLKKIIVFNSLGQILLQTETMENDVVLNMKSYPHGVYFIQVQDAVTTSSQKFILDD